MLSADAGILCLPARDVSLLLLTLTPRNIMPPIKVMTWNIQNFGDTKRARPSVMSALANVIYGSGADVVVIVEVQSTDALTDLRDQLNAISVLNGGNEWQHCFYSVWSPTATMYVNQHSHGEYYGILVRDLGDTPILGFAGPATDAQGYVNPGGLPAYVAHAASTTYANPNYTNYLPLLPGPSKSSKRKKAGGSGAYFLGGRPPCMFQMTAFGNTLHVIAAHFRPDVATAKAQLDSIAATTVFQTPADSLLITGDYNIDFSDVNDRDDDDATLMEYIDGFRTAGVNLLLSRGATHVNGSLYDNFMERGVQRRSVGILLPNAILKSLGAPFVDALKNAVANKALKARKLVTASPYAEELVAIASVVGKLNRNRRIDNDADTLRVFGLLSDHYPIMLEISGVA
jgi:endonuclease/exonuclease/phosphatase family metal-dependent hydrolase